MSNEKNTAEEKNKNPFQHTLNLPKTEFSIRANAQQKEPEILARWEAECLFEKASRHNEGADRFVLHDGPPYANGNLHMGHALSYILKDIVCKAHRMEGRYAPLVPGWDCHGLPIELKVTTELGIEKDRAAVDRVAFKKSCREYVAKWIDVQRKELKDLGKLADYERAYKTMDAAYEADILRAFAIFAEKGFIERKGKTVPWCASCQTVLATAEIEYQDRKDPSIFALFPLEKEAAYKTFPYCFEQDPALKVSFLVWTTTPWTLPLNRAVVLNPKATYALIAGKEEHQAYILGKELVDSVCAQMGIEKKILAECDAVVFEGLYAQHPFIDGQATPLILDEMVTVSEGTACLHSAPGCGPEDYLLGIKNGLEIFSPLSADGRYTVGIEPKELEGMAITDALGWVIKTMQDKGTLAHKASITHSYPHCWRCHQGLMFRATDQWFCDLKRNDLVDRSLAELEQLQFVPDWGKARLRAFIANRTEWCISRQRQWGVPIVALICTHCEAAYLDADFIRKVADKVADFGIEYWDRVTIPELVKAGLLPDGFCCKGCGNNDLEKFRQERDILDVWFDSGVSHFAVLAKDEEKLGMPADLYLEGSDQHRGWFQSSLLCGMVLNDKAPMKAILTHGYVVDEKKRKMSKSVGNVVAPQDVIAKHSRDILRLWVASVDYEGDVVISDKLLANVAEIYRKIRNTSRFLLSNLYDFDLEKDAVDIKDMLAIDQYALSKLHEVSQKVRTAYAEYHFSTVVQTLNTYCTKDLSALYLDVLKDRLYVEKPESRVRRSAQTVMYHILDVVTHLLAPVLSFTAEEVSDFYQKSIVKNLREVQEGTACCSIHLHPFVNTFDVWGMLSEEDACARLVAGATGGQVLWQFTKAMRMQNAWRALEFMRDAVLKAIERKREMGVVKHPLEVKLTMYFDKTSGEGAFIDWFMNELQGKEDVDRFFKDWFIVSQITFVESPQGLEVTDMPWLAVTVDHADGVKCPRCWQWETTAREDQLCSRCAAVLGMK